MRVPPRGRRVPIEEIIDVTLQAEYTVPVGASKDVFTRGLLSWYGTSQNDPSNPYDNVSAYAIANLYVGIRDASRNWEVALYCKNLTDVTRTVTVNRTCTMPSAHTEPGHNEPAQRVITAGG